MQPANAEHQIYDTNPDKNLGDISEYDRLKASAAPPQCPIQPKSDMCIVVQDEAALYVGEGSTKILIPDSKREKPRRGVVVATGPGYLDRETGKREPMQTNVGERVIFGEWAGTAFSYAGVQYLMMRESDLYGTIPPFSLEELRAIQEIKDAQAAEEARLAELREKHRQSQLEAGKSEEEIAAEQASGTVTTAAPQQDFNEPVPTEPSKLSLSTDINAAKPKEPRLQGRHGRRR